MMFSYEHSKRAASCVAENAPPSDDDIDDPYEPLQHDRPGPLAERPFKLRMPTKKLITKATPLHQAPADNFTTTEATI